MITVTERLRTILNRYVYAITPEDRAKLRQLLPQIARNEEAWIQYNDMKRELETYQALVEFLEDRAPLLTEQQGTFLEEQQGANLPV